MTPETTKIKTENLPAGENCLECSRDGDRKVKLCDKCASKVLHRYELCEHLTDYAMVQKMRRCEKCQSELDENFESFWKNIICDEQGNLDPEKVKSELFDFHFVMGEVAAVYGSITGGRLSKPNYHAHVVIGQVEQLKDEEICEAVTNAVSDEKEEILAYLKSQLEHFKLNRNFRSCLQMVFNDIQGNTYKPEIKENADEI